MMPSTVPMTPANQDRGEAHDHRDPRAEDEPGEHVAAEMVGAEQMRAAAPGLPDRRAEAVAERADLGIVGREQLGEDRHEGDAHEDGRRDDRETARPGGEPDARGQGRRGAAY